MKYNRGKKEKEKSTNLMCYIKIKKLLFSQQFDIMDTGIIACSWSF